MAIVKMKKVTITGAKEDKYKILKALQRASAVEVIDLREIVKEELEGVAFENKTITETEFNFNRVRQAYEFLRAFSDNKKGILQKREVLDAEKFEDFANTFNWMELSSRAKSLEEEINNLKAKKSKLELQIEHYEVWKNLDVSLKELNKLKKVSYFIGTVAKKYEAELINEFKNIDGIYIERISEKQQDLNIFVVCHRDDYNQAYEILKKYGFTKLTLELEDTPKNIITKLTNEISDIETKEEQTKNEAVKLSKSLDDLEKVYDYFSSQLEIERQTSKIINTKKSVILQGWVPGEKIGILEKSINKFNLQVYLEVEDAKDEDNPPVLLKNNPLIEPFEAITEMYALPLPNEVDPTPALAPFFLLFFGMMMADVGYGLLLGAVSLFLLFKADLSDSLKKMVKLIGLTSIPTVIFGVLYGSFFGGIIKIKPIWVDPVSDPMTILKYSIIFGVIHIYFGLAVKAYQLIKEGKIIDAVYDVVTWYGLVSGLIWLLLGGGTPAKMISLISALAIVLTQGRNNKTIAGKFFGGLYGLYGVTGYLGDILSYSRLLALGLASGLIGWSFNLLIELLGNGAAAFIAGPIIFIAGHTFNFLIGALGTFVHTCRLQYLEFFGKFYQGGGKAFKPLKISTKFIKVEEEI
ncbi:MAG: V-type synthase subunit [Caloramator sp.]|jgi:V/A-type H+-transporting ATPase subunit I|uniref:V-type ATP synthase subunit I n=1 Tax=Caloramator sp. TaxID=1871330 RepID=UPI001D5C32A2|nr:V-type ATP synthase subunit I [Caloramator sp.]MBZ4662863.1 V-type synthase subunit [Caloramator sp.]